MQDFPVLQIILDTNRVTKEPDINNLFLLLFLEKTTFLVNLVSIITDVRYDASYLVREGFKKNPLNQ